MMGRLKRKVAVIKKEKRNHTEEVDLENVRTSVRNHTEESKRDAVTIVKEWVSELRRKKAQETAHGFQSLFDKAG